MVRRKVAEVVDRSGLSPRSHSGKDLMAILEDYPRDELFQITTDDLFRTVDGRAADGRSAAAAAVPAPGRLRPVHLLPGLPAPGPVHHRQPAAHPGDPAARANGVGVDYTTRVTEPTLARVHFIVRTDPADPPGDIDADALAEQLADATRLWDDDFRLLLERKLGDEHRRRPVRAVRRRAARDRTRTSTRRTRRCRTSPSWSCSTSPASW